MKMLKKFAVVVTTALVCAGCDPIKDGNPYLTLVNTSERDIVYGIIGFKSNVQEDTLLDYNKAFFVVLPAKSTYRLPSSKPVWEQDFRSFPLFQHFIMDAALFEKYLMLDAPLDTLRKYVPILHRFPLTLQDAERMNWVVVYPPLKE